MCLLLKVVGCALGYLCAYLGPHIMGEWAIEQFATVVCGILAGVFVPKPQVLLALWRTYIKHGAFCRLLLHLCITFVLYNHDRGAVPLLA